MKNLNKFLLCSIVGVLLASCSNNKNHDYEPIVEYRTHNTTVEQNLYSVKYGDTVGSIATAHGVSRAEIIRTNNLTPPYELIPGQRLIINSQPIDADSLNAIPADGNTKNSDISIVQEGGLKTEYDTGQSKTTQLPVLPKEHTENEVRQDDVLQENSAIQLGESQELTESQTNDESKKKEELASMSYVWPVANGRSRITKTFDNQSGNILISTPGKTPVKAIADGIVKMAGKSGNEQLVRFGNMIVIQHKTHQKVSIYANVIDLKVKPGQSVSMGDIIASVGQSGIRGMTTSPALYFEIDKIEKGKKRQPVDPCTVLP